MITWKRFGGTFCGDLVRRRYRRRGGEKEPSHQSSQAAASAAERSGELCQTVKSSFSWSKEWQRNREGEGRGILFAPTTTLWIRCFWSSSTSLESDASPPPHGKYSHISFSQSLLILLLLLFPFEKTSHFTTSLCKSLSCPKYISYLKIHFFFSF